MIYQMPDCSDKELLDSQFVKKVEMWCCLLLGVKRTRKKKFRQEMNLAFLCTLELFQTREREKRKKKKNNFPRLQP